MRSDDPILYEQLHYICTSARKSTASDSVVMIIEFHDEKVDKPCTMMVFDSKEEDTRSEREIAQVALATLSGVNSMLQSMTNLEVLLKDTKTGKEMPLNDFNPQMIEVQF